MASPNSPDNSPVAPPPPPKNEGWPWPQIGLLTFNFGLFIAGLEKLILLAGMNFPEAIQTIGSFLIPLGLFILASHYIQIWGHKSVVDKAPFSPLLRRFNIGVACAWGLMFMLSLIIPGIHAARKAVERQVADEADKNIDTWQTVRSENSPVRVDLPAHWVEAPELAQGQNDLVRVDPVNELAFYLLSIPKEDVTHSSLTAWVDEALKEVNGSLQDAKLIERSYQAEPAPPGEEIVLEYTSENGRFRILMRFVEMQDHYLFVRAAASRSGFREHGETLRRIVRSVRIE